MSRGHAVPLRDGPKLRGTQHMLTSSNNTRATHFNDPHFVNLTGIKAHITFTQVTKTSFKTHSTLFHFEKTSSSNHNESLNVKDSCPLIWAHVYSD
jgi:hypothetical protein